MAQIRQCVWEGVGGLKVYNEHTVSQPKLDGSQYHLHIVNEKAVGLTSRRVSARTKKLSEKLYHFPSVKKQKFSKLKGETVIVCEVSADHLYNEFKNGELKDKKGKPFIWDKRSNYVASIMNSNESNNHRLILVAFDIIYWKGKYVENEPYVYKLELLEDYFYMYEFEEDEEYEEGEIRCIPTYDTVNKNEVMDFFNDVTVNKHLEGIVVKDLTTNASQKIKREKDADCIIIGYVDGTGKYAENNWIGSIIVGAFKGAVRDMNGNKIDIKAMKYQLETGNLIEVGKISGFDETFRKQVSQFKNRFLGRVVHCKYMQWTGNKMRHPRIGEKSIRTDKLIKRCTLEQFQET